MARSRRNFVIMQCLFDFVPLDCVYFGHLWWCEIHDENLGIRYNRTFLLERVCSFHPLENKIFINGSRMWYWLWRNDLEYFDEIQEFWVSLLKDKETTIVSDSTFIRSLFRSKNIEDGYKFKRDIMRYSRRWGWVYPDNEDAYDHALLDPPPTILVEGLEDCDRCVREVQEVLLVEYSSQNFHYIIFNYYKGKRSVRQECMMYIEFGNRRDRCYIDLCTLMSFRGRGDMEKKLVEDTFDHFDKVYDPNMTYFFIDAIDENDPHNEIVRKEEPHWLEDPVEYCGEYIGLPLVREDYFFSFLKYKMKMRKGKEE